MTNVSRASRSHYASDPMYQFKILHTHHSCFCLNIHGDTESPVKGPQAAHQLVCHDDEASESEASELEAIEDEESIHTSFNATESSNDNESLALIDAPPAKKQKTAVEFVQVDLQDVPESLQSNAVFIRKISELYMQPKGNKSAPGYFKALHSSNPENPTPLMDELKRRAAFCLASTNNVDNTTDIEPPSAEQVNLVDPALREVYLWWNRIRGRDGNVLKLFAMVPIGRYIIQQTEHMEQDKLIKEEQYRIGKMLFSSDEKPAKVKSYALACRRAAALVDDVGHYCLLLEHGITETFLRERNANDVLKVFPAVMKALFSNTELSSIKLYNDDE
ncbi:hypothetical protein MBANPS3_010496 [Mucor bainieri]